MQPIFVLLKKVALLYMEEASYRLSLHLSVLLRLMQAMADDQLKQMQDCRYVVASWYYRYKILIGYICNLLSTL